MAENPIPGSFFPGVFAYWNQVPENATKVGVFHKIRGRARALRRHMKNRKDHELTTSRFVAF